MSATHPDAEVEYSRAHGPSGTLAAVLACGLLGSLLLVISQFTTLYQVHLATSSEPIRTIGTGSNHAYSLIPIAVLAALLAYGTFRQRSLPALVALGLLGVIALVIALVVDLPDAQATGLVLTDGHYVDANSVPSAGLYMETLGAIALVIASGVGLLLTSWPERRR